MATSPPASLDAEGRALLGRLFDTAVRRLRERGVSLEYDARAVTVLLGQPGWGESLNPLRTLDGSWHRQVADAIEILLVRGELSAGGVVVVTAPPTASELRIAVRPSPAE